MKSDLRFKKMMYKRFSSDSISVSDAIEMLNRVSFRKDFCRAFSKKDSDVVNFICEELRKNKFYFQEFDFEFEEHLIEKISKFSCLGCIVFVSKNYFTEKTTYKEILQIKLANKKLVPFLIEQNTSVNELIQELFKDKKISKNEFNLYNEVFNKKIKFISLSTQFSEIAKLLNSLFELSDFEFSLCGISEYKIEKLHNRYIEKVTIPKEIEIENKILTKAVINPCLFSNCTYLQTVINDNDNLLIGEYAFSNCSHLEKIIGNGTIDVIKTGAFFNCFSLKEANLKYTNFIAKKSFENCFSLSSLYFGTDDILIEPGAFKGCINLHTLFCENINTINYLFELNILSDSRISEIYIFKEFANEFRIKHPEFVPIKSTQNGFQLFKR